MSNFPGAGAQLLEPTTPPLSMKLDGVLSQARDALVVVSTLNGRLFGYPPPEGEAAKLQAVRADSTQSTVDDLRDVIGRLHEFLIETNNRI